MLPSKCEICHYLAFSDKGYQSTHVADREKTFIQTHNFQTTSIRKHQFKNILSSYREEKYRTRRYRKHRLKAFIKFLSPKLNLSHMLARNYTE